MDNGIWTVEKAQQWYRNQPWLVGCNFIPSTAINQLEMWQADTFDPETIDQELGWAAGLGFNAIRVYLHDLLWLQDAAGFKQRIGHFLDLAQSHDLRTMFVLFDDCWHDNPSLGKQPEPRPGMHNSGWVKSPGTKVMNNPAEWGRLEEYVRDVVGSFGSDERVVVWDVYNEPGNNFLVSLNLPVLVRTGTVLVQLARHFLAPSRSAELLTKVFAWARAAQPIQPLTAGLWYLPMGVAGRLNRLSMDLSDVISFHSYFDLDATKKIVTKLQLSARPVICTEYLARVFGSKFETHMPYFKKMKVGCFNWGLVSGKTQTIYSWDHFDPSGAEPALWYHDVLRANGSPYRKEEADQIRQFTQK